MANARGSATGAVPNGASKAHARVVRPRRGRVLMIVGPDGTGKTTLCSALMEQLRTDVPVRVLANRRGAEPLSILPGRAPRGNTSVPHRHPPRSMAMSVAKLLYTVADMWLGWLVKVRPVVGNGGWVLIERGGWDLLVDPVRYRLRLPRWIGHAFARLMPRPSVVLVLEAAPEVITARKAQLPPPELARQMRAWHQVLPDGQRRLYLDTSAPIPELLRTISHAIRELDERGTIDPLAGQLAPVEVEPPHA